jgi:cytochrome P450
MNSIPRIEDFKDGFDPFRALLTLGGEGHIHEPLIRLAEVGAKTPVIEGDMQTFFGAPRQLVLSEDTPAFMALGFDACNHVLSTPEDFSNSAYEMHVGITFGQSITTMDAPIHDKYRRLFQQAFTPKMLAVLRPRFQEVIDRLVGQFADRGKADLVADMALHFPFQFICDLMDLPEEDRAVFHKLAHGQTCVMFDLEHGQEASRLLGNYLKNLIESRRALKSETDFVSLLTNVEIEGEYLPEEVLLGFFRQLMNAGGDTSFQSFSNILSVLFTHPAQLEAMRQDRNLIPRAIEEGLRWGAPITALDRTCTRDLELEGVKIPKGAIVRVCVAAGNRDARYWPDPHKFDIFREQRRHITFGYGPHICIGQFLARMELQMATNTLLDRLPNVRLDPDFPLPEIKGLTFRGADAVHVVWDRA